MLPTEQSLFMLGKDDSPEFDNRLGWDSWLREFAVKYYNATQRHAQVLRRREGMQYHLVRYEDLKSDLEGTLGRLLEFLGTVDPQGPPGWACCRVRFGSRGLGLVWRSPFRVRCTG